MRVEDSRVTVPLVKLPVRTFVASLIDTTAVVVLSISVAIERRVNVDLISVLSPILSLVFSASVDKSESIRVTESVVVMSSSTWIIMEFVLRDRDIHCVSRMDSEIGIGGPAEVGAREVAGGVGMRVDMVWRREEFRFIFMDGM